jgi:hypothetical protein
MTQDEKVCECGHEGRMHDTLTTACWDKDEEGDFCDCTRFTPTKSATDILGQPDATPGLL